MKFNHDCVQSSESDGCQTLSGTYYCGTIVLENISQSYYDLGLMCHWIQTIEIYLEIGEKSKQCK